MNRAIAPRAFLAKKDTTFASAPRPSRNTGVTTRSFSARRSTAPKYSCDAQFTRTSAPTPAACAFNARAIRLPHHA